MSARGSQLNVEHDSGIKALRDLITATLDTYMDVASPYALLDFPNHPNVGDSAIWLGELAYFETMYASRPAFVCEKDNCDVHALRKALPTGTIFLHGGGNFGDVWPKHHVFRESILERFPDRRIVQLPQSIHFADEANLHRTAAVIKAHGNFVLFVRDRHSFDLASSCFTCPVHLVPDMALWLGAIPRPIAATRLLLLLLRTDKECARANQASMAHLPDDCLVADWLDEDSALYQKQKRRTLAASVPALGVAAFSKMRQRELLFQHLAAHRLARGVELLSSASFVITDRLHCHILCVLLGIPHIALDNSYGKLGRFISTWTKDCGLVQMVPSLDEATALWSESRR